MEALRYVKAHGTAIDIGGGALRDTRYLLEKGFDVTVVDKNELMAKEALTIRSARLHHVLADFSEFQFPKNSFDIVSAMWSLPFNPPGTFETVFREIKTSLRTTGIFCGQLFGPNDDWNDGRKDMTFLPKDEIMRLLEDMDVISLREEEKLGRTTTGKRKYWHIFHIITRKVPAKRIDLV